jgi:uncharacterized cofD-like protein
MEGHRVARQKRVTIIGGGTGSFQVLLGLRAYEDLSLTSIVTMTDSGGDSGRLRDEFGVLPPGDIRRCLLALSEETELMRSLFDFRFADEPLRGRHFGNLFFLVLTKMLGSEKQAVAAIGKILKIKGSVLPVSWDNVHLCAELADGRVVLRECNIDKPLHDPKIPIRRVYLEPPAKANPEALQAIAESDYVVLAPGDLFTSTIPNLLVEGVPEALRAARAPLVYVLNLMTKQGETNGYTAAQHVEQIARYGGRAPDAALVHRGPIAPDMMMRYRAEAAEAVALDEERLRAFGTRLIRAADIMSPTSKARHDPARTASALREIFEVVNRG